MEDTDVGRELKVNKFTVINMIYICACVVIVLASFFPYVYSDQKTMSLMDSTDGIFFLMFTILIFIFIVYERKKTVGILSIVLLYLCAYELIHTYSVMSKSGEVISLKIGYYILLLGTVVLLVGVGSFVYQNGLKQQINKLFEKFFPLKETKE